MQQRQLRLGDILDDYCPRERRLTNHAVVAMIGPDVKQTRCTTCDAEHAYKHAKVPRQRRKSDSPPALYAQVAAGAPKRVPHEEQGLENAQTDAPVADAGPGHPALDPHDDLAVPLEAVVDAESHVEPADEEISQVQPADDEIDDGGADREDREEGPVHRPLIRASLPRPEGQPPPTRPTPDFTIRQPGGRPNRFRPRYPRGDQPFQGNRSNGNMGGPMRGRPPQNSLSSRAGRRNGPGRKRSK